MIIRISKTNSIEQPISFNTLTELIHFQELGYYPSFAQAINDWVLAYLAEHPIPSTNNLFIYEVFFDNISKDFIPSQNPPIGLKLEDLIDEYKTPGSFVNEYYNYFISRDGLQACLDMWSLV